MTPLTQQTLPQLERLLREKQGWKVEREFALESVLWLRFIPWDYGSQKRLHSEAEAWGFSDTEYLSLLDGLTFGKRREIFRALGREPCPDSERLKRAILLAALEDKTND